MKRLWVIAGVLVGMWQGSAMAQSQSGRDQCRGLGDPGTVSFPVAFSSVPQVAVVPATWLHETGRALTITTTSFSFECVTSTGEHNPGPMTWTAIN